MRWILGIALLWSGGCAATTQSYVVRDWKMLVPTTNPLPYEYDIVGVGAAQACDGSVDFHTVIETARGDAYALVQVTVEETRTYNTVTVQTGGKTQTSDPVIVQQCMVVRGHRVMMRTPESVGMDPEPRDESPPAPHR